MIRRATLGALVLAALLVTHDGGASLETDCVWAGGVWDPTVWADDVWDETCGAPPVSGDGGRRRSLGLGLGF